MPLLRPSSLFLSSICFVMLSCSPTKGLQHKGRKRVSEQMVQAIVNKENSLLYRTEIKAYGKRFSGIVILKQTSADTSHLSFITQLGMTMFDYVIVRDSFRLAYVFEPLNKPRIKKLLYNDFSHMLLFPLYKYPAEHFEKNDLSVYRLNQSTRLYYVCRGKKVERIVNKGKVFKKEIQKFEYGEDGNAENIRIRHKGFFPLKMDLQRIEKLK